MTNTEELLNVIKGSGISITFLAEKLGISRTALYSKINNNVEFRASEISTLCEILGINTKGKEAIFFAR